MDGTRFFLLILCIFDAQLMLVRQTTNTCMTFGKQASDSRQTSVRQLTAVKGDSSRAVTDRLFNLNTIHICVQDIN